VVFLLKSVATVYTERALNFGLLSKMLRSPAVFSLKERRNSLHRACPQFRTPQQEAKGAQWFSSLFLSSLSFSDVSGPPHPTRTKGAG